MYIRKYFGNYVFHGKSFRINISIEKSIVFIKRRTVWEKSKK